MWDAAEGFSAFHDSPGYFWFLSMAGLQAMDHHQPGAADDAVKRTATRQALQPADREPVGQDHGGWRVARVRCGQSGERANGRKGHILADTDGRLVAAQVRRADAVPNVRGYSLRLVM
jgi:hypothetical protein